MGQSRDVPDVPIWRLTLEQYHQMISAGILKEDDPIEFLEGWLVPKMPKTPLHESVIRKLKRQLARLIGEQWELDSQSPVALVSGEPEPDLVIVRYDESGYEDEHPTLDDIALVIEVSHSSLDVDQGPKLRSYARAGFREYWIVNLAESCFEVYTEPSGPARKPKFRQRRDYRAGESVPVRIRGKVVGHVAVSAVLP
jgi:Uma2 family endonuclease